MTLLRTMPAALWLALHAMGCKASAAEGSLSREAAVDGPMEVPTPPADGPRLLALRDATPVLDRPAASGRVLGELRAGGVVARSEAPYSRAGCAEGWYAVRPRGFVCAGENAAIDAGARAALPPGPNLARPLPYRYGRARSEGVEVYPRLPSAAEQLSAEPDLGRHLARAAADADLLGAAANDVPLDPRGVPTGPPVILPGGDGVDATGKRTARSFFAFGGPELPPPQLGAAPAKAAPLRKGSGVAVAASFLAEGGSGPRRFGLMPDGRLVPTDRLRPALGSTWHGVDVEKVGLPLAFVHKRGVNTWTLRKGKATKNDEELERRSPLALSGKFRTVDGIRFEQTKEGPWVRTQDVVVIVRRAKFPEFAVGGQKWIDVSLANQTLTAYEGRKAVYATLISSGRDQIGDPAQTASTVRGTFRVRRKAVTAPIDAREVYGAFEVADAPWVIEFGQGYAITGNYWSDPMGEAQGFHNVAMSPIDAHRIWTWADPQVPEGWHAVTDGGAETTMIFVRP